MITFTSPECLSKISPTDPSYSTIKELLDRSVQESKRAMHHWVPEQDGFFILVEPEDLKVTLDELHPGKTLLTIPYEGTEYYKGSDHKVGHYIAVSLLNNQASLVWVFPEGLLSDDLLEVLQANLVPESGEHQPK